MSTLTSDDSYVMDAPWKDYSAFSNYSCCRDDSEYHFQPATSDSFYSERAYCCMSPYSYLFDSNKDYCVYRDRFLSEDDVGGDHYPCHHSSFSYQEVSHFTPALLSRDYDSLSTGCVVHLDQSVQDDSLKGPLSDPSSSDHECPSSTLTLQPFPQVNDDLVLADSRCSAHSVCDSLRNSSEGYLSESPGRYLGDAMQGYRSRLSEGYLRNASDGYLHTTSNDYVRTTSNDYVRTTSNDYVRTTSNDYVRTTSNDCVRTTSNDYVRTTSNDYVRTTSNDYACDTEGCPRSANDHLHNSSESLNEPSPTTHRDTEKKRPEKSSKNYDVMEVKVPPIIRTGHPKQRRGPKKTVTSVTDEKPGNPEDIDPVDTPTSRDP